MHHMRMSPFTDLRQEDTRNSEYLSRAVVKYRFEANEDYKDQMSVEKDDQLLVKVCDNAQERERERE